MEELSIATSIWNAKEVLGVFDVKRRKGWLTEDEFKKALRNFVSETVRLLRLKIFPILTSMPIKAWPLILMNILRGRRPSNISFHTFG